jgi:hypothetical protein
MADANTILGSVVLSSAPMTVTALLANDVPHAEPRVMRNRRKEIIRSLACLMKRGLVKQERVRKQSFDDRTPEALYTATKEGVAFYSARQKVKCGPKKQRRDARAYAADAFYQRLWTALRIAQGKRGTLPELIEIARLPADPENLADNARQYFMRLKHAGIITALKQREKGSALTSNGFVRFALLKDVGPLAPVTRVPHVFDPNTRTTIPYADKTK